MRLLDVWKPLMDQALEGCVGSMGCQSPNHDGQLFINHLHVAME